MTNERLNPEVFEQDKPNGHVHFRDHFIGGRYAVVSPLGNIVASAATSNEAQNLCDKLDAIDRGEYRGDEL